MDMFSDSCGYVPAILNQSRIYQRVDDKGPLEIFQICLSLKYKMVNIYAMTK